MKHSFDFTAANKYRCLNPQLKQTRLALLDYAIAHPAPFSVERAKQIVTAPDLVESLIHNNLISLNEEGEIAYLYPVSCEETVHRVKLADGRAFWAMCAIDALGCAATFGMNAEIFSATKDTEEDVYALVSPNGIETIKPDGMLVSYYDSWAESGVNY